MPHTTCFKAYDVRGAVPHPLSPALVKAIGMAFVRVVGATSVVVGWDCRLSGPALSQALMEGLHEAGADVTAIGLCGTEEIYFATATQGFEGGIMVTGSHNPAQENGLKFVRENAIPISGDSGLHAIRDMALQLLEYTRLTGKIAHNTHSYRQEYIRFLLEYTGAAQGKGLKIHADAGNGCAGVVLQELMPHLPHSFSVQHMEPDGTFPHGVPNPLLPERRAATAQMVRQQGARLGLAWDGDFDRCFFYDAQGNFIEGYYIVGLLAQSMLERFPHSRIIHDPRLIWNTEHIVQNAGGTPVICKAGHAFMKEGMRREDAIYGGEMSAHHFFRDFAYCDSGMLPWLLVAQLLVQKDVSFASLVENAMRRFPCSGEINRRVADAPAILQNIQRIYEKDAITIEHIDGLSMNMGTWRFNVRSSNTEPLLRLNVESRGDAALMKAKTEELLRYIGDRA